jgi:hypothetical protein
MVAHDHHCSRRSQQRAAVKQMRDEVKVSSPEDPKTSCCEADEDEVEATSPEEPMAVGGMPSGSRVRPRPPSSGDHSVKRAPCGSLECSEHSPVQAEVISGGRRKDAFVR